jgi:hypothetical protein
MDYSDIVVKHTNTYIDNIRRELHYKILDEFCAAQTIENPYLSREEINALATKSFENCPNNIYISSESSLTIAGYYLNHVVIDELRENKCYSRGRGGHSYGGGHGNFSDNLRYIVKLYYDEMVLPLCKVNETDKYHLTFTSSEERDIEFYKEKYYVDLNRTYYYGGKQFHNVYPKMPLRMMSRYMIEFITRENPDILALPFAIKYDFYLQERMGFINLYKSNCKIAEMNELIDAHKNMVVEFDKRSAAKLQEIAEKERITDKYIESAQKYREETKAQLYEREQELNTKSAALEIHITKNLVTVRDDLLGLCEEMLIMSNGDHKMHEIKQKLMQIYSNTVGIAIATPISN